MNFYPLLLQSFNISKQIKIFLINALPWMIIIAIKFLGWQLWWQDFFALVRNTLTATQIQGDTLKILVEQVKHIINQLLLFIPIWLIIWRLAFPIGIRAMEHRPLKMYLHKAGYIFVFDACKILLAWIVYTILRITISSNPLIAVISLIIGIFAFSSLCYMQVAFFVEKPNDNIKILLGSWYQQLPAVIFLHILDMVVALISFCLLGLILASISYLPWILLLPLVAILSITMVKLWVIRKALWVYAVSAMLKLNNL